FVPRPAFLLRLPSLFFLLFMPTASPGIYTLSLHDALPISVMVQREAAQRLCAEPGTRAAGAISYAVAYYATPRQLFTVQPGSFRSEEHTSELQSRFDLVCRLLLEKKKIYRRQLNTTGHAKQ